MARPFSFIQDALEMFQGRNRKKGISRSLPISTFAQRDRRPLGSSEPLFHRAEVACPA